MKKTRSFYYVVPDAVMFCEGLTDKSRLIYGLITGLCTENGYCWANNNYFAELFKVSTETISRSISLLEKHGFVEVIVEAEKGNSRKIYLTESGIIPNNKNIKRSQQKHQEVLTKTSRGLDENVKHNTKVNIKENNKEREARALDFLKTEYQFRFEQEFEMRYKSKIKNFEKFCEDFNDKVDTEDLEYTGKKLFARLGQFTRNWIENQKKFSGDESPAPIERPKNFM